MNKIQLLGTDTMQLVARHKKLQQEKTVITLSTKRQALSLYEPY